MPHIALPEGLPGITSGFAFRPETAGPMRELAEVPLTPKMKALLAITGKVQQGGKQVTATDVDDARAAGASDLEIHDAVLAKDGYLQTAHVTA